MTTLSDRIGPKNGQIALWYNYLMFAKCVYIILVKKNIQLSKGIGQFRARSGQIRWLGPIRWIHGPVRMGIKRWLLRICDNWLRGFPCPICGLNIGPFSIQKWAKLPIIVNNIPNTLALQFGENPNKNSKVTDVYIHTLVHIYSWAIIWRPMHLHWYLLRSSSIRPNLVFPILMAQMIFSQIQQAPGLGLARLIEISVNRSIYKRKTIINMKIQKSVTFDGYSVYLFN